MSTHKSLFVGLLILLLFLFVASATGILIQLSRTANPPGLKNNWNALVVGASYILLGCISAGYFVVRTIKSRRRLARISIPSFDHDGTPLAVQRYIQAEYFRSCAIAHASLPIVTSRPGWGSPGSVFDGIRFRRALLDTLNPLDQLMCEVLPQLTPLLPNEALMDHLNPLIPLFPDEEDPYACLETYTRAIEIARQGEAELTEDQFIDGMQACGHISRILDKRKDFDASLDQ